MPGMVFYVVCFTLLCAFLQCLQIKESQPKPNEDWSECAKKGYAGMLSSS